MNDFCLKGSWGSVYWRCNLKIERVFNGMKQKTVIQLEAIPESMKRQGWRLSSENGKRLKKGEK